MVGELLSRWRAANSFTTAKEAIKQGNGPADSRKTVDETVELTEGLKHCLQLATG